MVFKQFFFYSSEEIRMKVFLCLLLLAVGANCLYSDDSNVVDLNPDNFDKLVTNGDEVWIVEFFAPWCGHCQALTPQYDKAADALKGIVKVGAVDADEHKVLAGRFGVRGFPTIKIFGADKKKPEDYNGDRTASALVDAGLSAAKDAAKASLRGKRTTSSGGAKSSSSSKSSGSKSKSSGGGGGSCDSQCNSGGGSSKNYKPSDSKDVVELTDDNFDNLVLNSKDVWLVEFFAPWCGHCKNLAPEWAAAATELKGKVKLGALDATVHTAKAQEYGVKGYPTIKYFAPGSDYSDAADYDGGRTSDAIVSWALEKWSENASPPEVLELVGESVFKDACDDKQLCVVSVLPHIYDCQSSCRNGYLKTLKSLTEKYKQKNWGWVWSEAGAQPEVEEALEIGGFGYPALAVVNPKKLKYSLLRGSFSYDGINDFLRSLGYGKGGIAPIRGAQLPKVRSTDSWDGEDRLPPQEEEIDLSDVDLDEKDEL